MDATVSDLQLHQLQCDQEPLANVSVSYIAGLESLVHQPIQGISCGKNHGENEEYSQSQRE